MVPDFAQHMSPLTDLLRKDKQFTWGPDQQKGFQRLKTAFARSEALAMHDPTKVLEIYTDASDRAIGGVAKQQGNPIGYYSRKLRPAEKNYSVGDKEMLAILTALTHWRQYTQGARHQVVVLTDHRALTCFTTTKELSQRQMRWMEELAGYDFIIKHIPGQTNKEADALSRRPDYDNIQISPRAFLKKDGPDLKLDFEPTEDNNDIIRENHDHPLAGHQGVKKTLKRIQEKTRWKGMKADVERYIAGCHDCLSSKKDKTKKQGQHNPLETPGRPFQAIALDFVTGFPESEDPATGQSYDMVMTVIDLFTKYAKFIPCRTTMDAEQLAFLMNKEIFSDHGIPDSIVSDRDKLFTSKFFKGWTDSIGAKQRMSTAFHPETDGQTERMNQTLEVYLRIFASENKHKWVQLLPNAMAAINSSYSEGLGQTPFDALYGRNIRKPEFKESNNDQANWFAKEMEENWTRIKARVEKAKNAVKERLDPKRRPTEIKEGQHVLLSTKNLTSDKLDKPFIGPYEVERVSGPVATLKLPGTKTFPKFHVSLLKSAPPSMPLATTWTYDVGDEYEVDKILDHKNEDGQTTFLVKWKGYPLSESTWEPRANLDHARTAMRKFRKSNIGGAVLRPRSSTEG